MKRASFLFLIFLGSCFCLDGGCGRVVYCPSEKNKMAQTVGPRLDQHTRVTATVQLRLTGPLPLP